MKTSINLLIKRNASEEKAESQYAYLRVIATIALSTVGIISVVLMILIATSPLPELHNNENTAIATISQLHPKMAKIIISNERLDTIETILNKRSSLDKTIDWIKSSIPAQMTITNYRVDNKVITLTLETSSLDSINALTSTINGPPTSQLHVGSAVLSTITFDPDKGSYSMNLEVDTL